MNPKSQKLRADAKALIVACKAILEAATNGQPTEDQTKEIAAKRREAADMVKAAENFEAVENELAAFDKTMPRNSGGAVIDAEDAAIDPESDNAMDRVHAVGARKIKRATAYKFGMFAAKNLILSGVGNVSRRMAEKCRDMEFSPSALQIEGSDIPGGNLVPPEFLWEMINLRETFGTFRRNVAVKNMTRDTLSIPRRTSGLTMYLVGEAARITASSKKWDQIKLVAKKCGVLAVSSAELDEDSAIDIGSDLMSEIAYAMALGEDQAGWNGDGTSGQATEYLGMIGVRYKLKNLNGTISKIPGLTVASGTGYATNYNSVALADFNNVVGNLPAYADTPSCKWYCHRTFYYQVMQKLAAAAGGVTFHEIIEGVRRPMFLGYPVEFVQAFPRTSGVSQVCALFGDLGLAAKMGNRKELEFGVSRDATVVDNGTTYSLFQNDMIAWRGIERFDINVHDVGRDTDSYTATVDIPGQGPIVGLITASS